jgi:hypothetical protein
MLPAMTLPFLPTAFAVLRLSAVLALVFGAALPRPASAHLGDVHCDDSARLERALGAIHGARKLGRGMRGPDVLLEIWIAPSSGDWTLVQTYANGTSCIVAMGEDWESAPLPPGPA